LDRKGIRPEPSSNPQECFAAVLQKSPTYNA